MSIPMICCAAARASSGVRASLMPPAFPRPPTGTCALTATGPSFAHAAAASSGLRATAPGGMAMPSEERTSLAWYSRSFTLLGRLERAGRLRVLRVVVPAVAEALAERRAVDQDDSADDKHDHDDECEPAADQDRGQCGDTMPRGRLTRRPPRSSVPVLESVVGDPRSIRVLSRHLESSLLAQRDAPVVASHPATFRIFEWDLAHQLESSFAADGVGGPVLEGRKGVYGLPPPCAAGNLYRLLDRSGCDASTLKLGQHSPTHLVHLPALPLALPEVDAADDLAGRHEHDLED